MQTILQGLLRQLTRRLPYFRGLGRCILAADALCSSKSGNESSLLLATVNDGCRILVDGRVLEQKFAFYYGEWELELIHASMQHYTRARFTMLVDRSACTQSPWAVIVAHRTDLCVPLNRFLPILNACKRI